MQLYLIGWSFAILIVGIQSFLTVWVGFRPRLLIQTIAIRLIVARNIIWSNHRECVCLLVFGSPMARVWLLCMVRDGYSLLYETGCDTIYVVIYSYAIFQIPPSNPNNPNNPYNNTHNTTQNNIWREGCTLLAGCAKQQKTSTIKYLYRLGRGAV